MVIRKDQPFDGACYHIVLRGNNRTYVLEEARDKQKLVRLLKDYKKQGDFELFHYCIMDNHAHLVMRLVHGERLAKLMQGLCQSFTNHWKRTRGFVGCLWQPPYRRFLIRDPIYLLECGRYVERNPVRASIVKNPADYPWSSYCNYGSKRKDSLIDLNPEYLGMSPRPAIRRRLYRKYVEVARPYESMLDAALMKHTLRRVNPWEETTLEIKVSST